MNGPEIGSPDTGTSYFARGGKTYARRHGVTEECGSARSANGRELDRFQAALDNARRQREAIEHAKESE